MTTQRFDALIALSGSAGAPDYFSSWAVDHSRLLLAADGGADHLLAIGRLPEIIVGDFDSLSNDTLADLPSETILFRLAREKDYTDGELATAVAVLLACGQNPEHLPGMNGGGHELYRDFGAVKDLTGRAFVFLNHAGRRIDHQTANLALARLLAVRGADVYLTDGVSLARIVRGPAVFEDVFPDDCFEVARAFTPGRSFLFSALPLDDQVSGLSLGGLRWELDQVRLPLGRSLGLSNRGAGLYPVGAKGSLLSGTVMLYTCPEDL